MAEMPRLAGPPMARNTRTAAMSTSDWATWTTSVPAKALHHSLASPSVWGRAWQTSAGGGDDEHDNQGDADHVGGSSTSASTATTAPTKTRKMPWSDSDPRTSWLRTAAT